MKVSLLHLMMYKLLSQHHQGQMIQLHPISAYTVTQQNLENNSQINISPQHPTQCNQQHQPIMLSPLLILTHLQSNNQINPHINISPPHAVQFNQQYHPKSQLIKANEKNYFSITIYNINYTVSYQELYNFF